MEKINLKESETIELKKSTYELKEALVSISAILNKNQEGEIYFGVKNDGTVIGQDVSERTIRLIDVWGRGILNSIKFLKAEGLDKPKFEESGGSFRIIFKRLKPSEIAETTQKTLDLVRKNPKITREELAKLLNLTPDGVKYNLSVLKKQGKLKRIGGRKEGYWEVLEK